MRQLTSQPLEYPSRPGSKGCKQRGAGFAAYRIRNEGNIDHKDLTYCRNIFNIHSISSISGVILWPHLLHCGYPLKAQQVVKMAIHGTLGLVCCIPSFLLVLTFHMLRTKIAILPPGISVEWGSIEDLCIATLCCVGCMTFLAALAPLMA